jgi:hypothetical protein
LNIGVGLVWTLNSAFDEIRSTERLEDVLPLFLSLLMQDSEPPACTLGPQSLQPAERYL